MTHTVLFIGPSLSSAEVASHVAPGVDVRMPVRRGDFESLPPTVELAVIVDGVFFSDQAVAPREILGALRSGIKVWGASSMGALRAAELSPFGMEGVGEVFRMYAEGEIDSDADVALVFNPETGVALSEPVVNIIHMLRLAEQGGVLDRPNSDRVLEIARSIYFTDLSYRSLFVRCRGELPDSVIDDLAAFVSANAVEGDLKRRDAIAAIDSLNSFVSGSKERA